MDDVKLRNKSWVEMLPKGPGDEDVDAIESEFFTFKGKAKTCQYLPNKVLDLYLGISYAKRIKIDNYIEDSYNIKTVSDKSDQVSVCYKVFSVRTPMRLTMTLSENSSVLEKPRVHKRKSG